MRKTLKRVSAAACGLLALAAGCSSAEEPSLFAGTIIVGVGNDAPGFAVGDLNPAGFDITMMKTLGAKLGRPVTSTFITSADREPRLKSKNVTLVVHTYSITGDRNAAGIDFAGPYMVSSQALLVRAGTGLTDRKSLKGKTVCTVGTTTGSGVTIPGAVMGKPGTVLATTRDCVDALLAGNTDAVFTDTLILEGYAAAYRNKLDVILPGAFGQNQYYGIGLLGGHPEECRRLNEIITEYLRTQWRQDFLAALPTAAETHPGTAPSGDFESVFKPSEADMDRLSCRL